MTWKFTRIGSTSAPTSLHFFLIHTHGLNSDSGHRIPFTAPSSLWKTRVSHRRSMSHSRALKGHRKSCHMTMWDVKEFRRRTKTWSTHPSFFGRCGLSDQWWDWLSFVSVCQVRTRPKCKSWTWFHLTFVASTCALDNCECASAKLPFPFLQQDHQPSVTEVHHRTVVSVHYSWWLAPNFLQ